MAQVKSITSAAGDTQHVRMTGKKIKFSHLNGKTYTRSVWANWNDDMFVKIGKSFYAVKYDVSYGLRSNFHTETEYKEDGVVSNNAEAYFDLSC